jgi:hypothetical protein
MMLTVLRASTTASASRMHALTQQTHTRAFAEAFSIPIPPDLRADPKEIRLLARICKTPRKYRVPKDDHPSQPGNRHGDPAKSVEHRRYQSGRCRCPLGNGRSERDVARPPSSRGRWQRIPSQALLRMSADAIIESPVSTRSSTDSIVEREIPHPALLGPW